MPRYKTVGYSVEVSYPIYAIDKLDSAREKAVGRTRDFSCAVFEMRDIGWLCPNELEAHRVRQQIRRVLGKAWPVSIEVRK